MKIPKSDDIKLINNRTNIVFKKLKLTRFLFKSIEIFVIADIIDIDRYPIKTEYVPKYLGKNIIHKIKIDDEIAWDLRYLSSRPKAFNIDDEIWDNPNGSITMLA